eukprot:jgi/Galph1/4592/GphlegSOOS_G3234.1
MINDKEMPLSEHFMELRRRLLKSIISIIISVIIIFFNTQYIVKVIQKPAEGIKFIQLSPGEYFFSTIKISLYFGLLISLPYILYEILQFTIPAMTRHEKKIILPLSIISAILFFGGIAFQVPILEILLAMVGLISSRIILLCSSASFVNAYPIYAQQAYEYPRENTGRIVCANCHLAQKPIQLEIPKSVLPGSVFNAVVKIDYPNNAKQLLANGTTGQLNIGAILVLPKGFSLAPINKLSEKEKEIAKLTPIQTYNNQHKNILVVGPLPGDKYKELVFPILAPDPKSNKEVHFIKYPIYAGGNRGRGQIYPNGDKSNNALYTSSTDGKIVKIEKQENNSIKLLIQDNNDNIITENLPPGIQLIVSEGQNIKTDQVLNKDLNIGGFGQTESEFVLQNESRIKGMVLFFFSITLTQILLILKKKQFEKVQAKQLNI